MKLQLRAVVMLLMLALTAGSALAQETTTAAAPTGPKMAILLAGLATVLVLGLMTASKNSTNDSSD